MPLCSVISGPCRTKNLKRRERNWFFGNTGGSRPVLSVRSRFGPFSTSCYPGRPQSPLPNAPASSRVGEGGQPWVATSKDRPRSRPTRRPPPPISLARNQQKRASPNYGFLHWQQGHLKQHAHSLRTPPEELRGATVPPAIPRSAATSFCARASYEAKLQPSSRRLQRVLQQVWVSRFLGPGTGDSGGPLSEGFWALPDASKT